MGKLRSIAFQRCILRGVFIWSKSVKTRIFSKKNCLKTEILSVTIPDELTLEGLGPQILKVLAFFTCSLKNLGHKLSDEALGIPEARWRQYCPIDDHNFFWKYSEKMQTCIFGHSLSGKLWLIDVATHAGYHHVKADVLRILKMCNLVFLVFLVFSKELQEVTNLLL